MSSKLLITIMLLGGLFGCASQEIRMSQEEVPAREGRHGPWTNIYSGDPNLAGVIVQQFPDGDDTFSFEERDGRHPCMILFGFWDDGFHQIGYTPSGVMTDDHWFTIAEPTKWIWDRVDFSKGSRILGSGGAFHRES